MSTKLVPLALTAVTSLLLVTGCSSSHDNANKSGSATSSPPSTSSSAPDSTDQTSSAPDGSGQSAMIDIKDFAFTGPASVSPGAKVMVMNQDAQAHTVTSDDGTSFDVTVAPGDTATFTAPAKAGDYAYHCTFHSNMVASLTVK